MNTTEIFFQLLQVAIGSQKSISFIPNMNEWNRIYELSYKQALLGITFYGMQKLRKEKPEQTEYLSPKLRMQWLAMAVGIQKHNKLLNKRCEELHDKFKDAGFRTCILKGQGVATLYNDSNNENIENSLSTFRQPGDIDIWVEGDRDVALDFVRSQGVKVSYIDSVHAHADFFEDVEVEVHSRPSWMYNSKHDKIFMDFWKGQQEQQFSNSDKTLGFCYPTVAFNLVYSLLHINRHIFAEGIGLRQLIDYYFILKASTKEERDKAFAVLERMNLKRFTAGIMYIERKVLGLDEDNCIVKPDIKEGEFLLNDILIGGNFGKYDGRNVSTQLDERWKRGVYTLIHNFRYLTHYPSEVFAIPIWKVWHYVWRKTKGYM